jgi:hypothetical protein
VSVLLRQADGFEGYRGLVVRTNVDNAPVLYLDDVPPCGLERKPTWGVTALADDPHDTPRHRPGSIPQVGMAGR